MVEGHKEDKAGWLAFLKQLKERGLQGVRLVISDACLGLVDALAEVFPDADWQRCVVHFYRNVFSHVPNGKVRQVAAMLKAIHAQENRNAAQRKAQEVIETLKTMKLRTAAALVDSAVSENLYVLCVPAATLAPDQDQQSDGTAPTGSPAQNPGGRGIPGRSCGLDAGVCTVAACLWNQVGHP